jgi:hypothetical protein
MTIQAVDVQHLPLVIESVPELRGRKQASDRQIGYSPAFALPDSSCS